MSANATPRAHRRAVLESRLSEFSGWLLAIDCGAPSCRRGRAYPVEELAGVIGRQVTIGALLRRMRCQECGARPAAVFRRFHRDWAADGSQGSRAPGGADGRSVQVKGTTPV
jgi:hypothetical protein